VNVNVMLVQMKVCVYLYTKVIRRVVASVLEVGFPFMDSQEFTIYGREQTTQKLGRKQTHFVFLQKQPTTQSNASLNMVLWRELIKTASSSSSLSLHPHYK